MKISREFKIGLLFIIGLFLLFWGYNFLKGKNVFSEDRIYYGVYAEISGLKKANKITINGLEVGMVKDIYFSGNNSGNIIVVLSISNDFPIPENSIAKIFSADLMGTKQVAIILGNGTNMTITGDTLQTEVEASLKDEVNRQMQPLKNKAEQLMGTIDSVFTVFKLIFNEKATNSLSNSFTNIEKTFSNLQHTSARVDTLIEAEANRLSMIFSNIESISSNLNRNEQNITDILTNFSAISDTLAKANVATTFVNINKTLNEFSFILEKINKGEGTIGAMLMNDSLYLNLMKSSESLNKLLEDVRKRPKRYVKFSLF